MSEKPLQDRLCLVTGASRGLGRAAALAMAADGAQLILVARTQGALEEVDDAARKLGAPRPVLVVQDLADHQAIDNLGAALYQRFGRLDALIGAAGILGELSPLPHLAPRDWNDVFSINVTANFRLIRSLDPLLRLSTAGRALFITDRTPTARAYWGCYSASQAALEILVLAWAEELRSTKIKVNLLSPGPMTTRLRARAFPGEPPEKQSPPEAIAPLIAQLARADEKRHGEIIAC